MTILSNNPKDSEADDKSKKVQSVSEGSEEKHGMDYWVRTQKEQWPGSEIDKSTHKSYSARISGKDQEILRREVLKNSRLLRDHPDGRTTLFHPLNHAQGPSQSRHVPNIRISLFIKKPEQSCEVFIDNWKEGEKELPDKLRKAPGWTAFVYQVPPSLLKVKKP